MSSLDRMEDLRMHGVPIELREMLGKWKFWQKNHVESGLVVGAPTTGSTHADGSTYDFNVNISSGMITIGNHRDEPSAATDFDVAHGSTSPVGATNTDITYTIVAKEAVSTHTISYMAVAGAAAPVGTSVAPTAAQIQTAVGAGNNWVRIGTTTVHRSGASAVTQTYSNTAKAACP